MTELAPVTSGNIVFTAGIGAPAGIGTAGSTTGSTSLPVPVTSAVPANNTVIVAIVLYNNPAPTVTVTDSAGNTYTKDADITYSGATRTLVFSGLATTALTTSSTITVNFNGTSVAYKNASAFYVSGLVAASPKDKTATATGTNKSPSVGPTSTTSQADELLIGAFGVDDGSGSASFAAGANYTALPANVTNSGMGIFPNTELSTPPAPIPRTVP